MISPEVHDSSFKKYWNAWIMIYHTTAPCTWWRGIEIFDFKDLGKGWFVMLSDKTIASHVGIFQKLEQCPSLCAVCPRSYPIHYDRKVCIVYHMRYNIVLWKCVSVSMCSQMGIFMLFINKSMLYFFMLCISIIDFTTVQWTAAVVPASGRLVFESQQRQTLVAKTGSDSSTAKRSAIGVSVTGPRRWPL